MINILTALTCATCAAFEFGLSLRLRGVCNNIRAGMPTYENAVNRYLRTIEPPSSASIPGVALNDISDIDYGSSSLDSAQPSILIETSVSSEVDQSQSQTEALLHNNEADDKTAVPFNQDMMAHIIDLYEIHIPKVIEWLESWKIRVSYRLQNIYQLPQSLLDFLSTPTGRLECYWHYLLTASVAFMLVLLTYNRHQLTKENRHLEVRLQSIDASSGRGSSHGHGVQDGLHDDADEGNEKNERDEEDEEESQAKPASYPTSKGDGTDTLSPTVDSTASAEELSPIAFKFERDKSSRAWSPTDPPVSLSIDLNFGIKKESPTSSSTFASKTIKFGMPAVNPLGNTVSTEPVETRFKSAPLDLSYHSRPVLPASLKSGSIVSKKASANTGSCDKSNDMSPQQGYLAALRYVYPNEFDWLGKPASQNTRRQNPFNDQETSQKQASSPFGTIGADPSKFKFTSGEGSAAGTVLGSATPSPAHNAPAGQPVDFASPGPSLPSGFDFLASIKKGEVASSPKSTILKTTRAGSGGHGLKVSRRARKMRKAHTDSNDSSEAFRWTK